MHSATLTGFHSKAESNVKAACKTPLSHRITEALLGTHHNHEANYTVRSIAATEAENNATYLHDHIDSSVSTNTIFTTWQIVTNGSRQNANGDAKLRIRSSGSI